MDNPKKIKLDSPELLCSFCGECEVERVPEYFPWTVDHWACSSCNSTFDISVYPKKNQPN